VSGEKRLWIWDNGDTAFLDSSFKPMDERGYFETDEKIIQKYKKIHDELWNKKKRNE